MCGIFGYIGREHINLKKATDIIKHRGPDSSGYLQYRCQNKELLYNTYNIDNSYTGQHVLYGFRRLAIIDLGDRSNQPFSTADGKYHIVFNGEIYNYKELRVELIGLGHVFNTDSDTEVLLCSYIEWGADSFSRFNGMWSFSILDLNRNVVLCCRDRFGIKPFYYNLDLDKEAFVFGSELKQILCTDVKKRVNERVLLDYLDNGIVDYGTETFYNDIYSLEPGSYIEMDLDQVPQLKFHKYWSLEENVSEVEVDYDVAVSQFQNKFNDSVKLRFRSDVPVGSCLSGGLDSSSVVCTAANLYNFEINTFTSKYSIKEYDESNYAALVSKMYPNVKSSYCELDESIFLSDIDRILFHQDEPFGSMGTLAQWMVMKTASKAGIKVLLDGQGGDELLGGYRKYYAFFLKDLLSRFQLIKFGKELYYLLRNKEFNFFNSKGIKRYLGLKPKRQYLSDKGKKLSHRAKFNMRESSSMQQRSRMDIEKLSFPPLLRYEDRNSMAFSIETRVPFMDYNLVEFSYNLGNNKKIRKGFTKAILRDSMKGILPDKIRMRISKLGFATPQDLWMDTTLRDFFTEYFRIMDNPYLDAESIFLDFTTKPLEDSNFYFRMFCFDRWCKLNCIEIND